MCRRQYPGGAEGLVVPGGPPEHGGCPRPAARFFLVKSGSSLYATCDEHAPDVVVGNVRHEEVGRETAEVFLVMAS